MIGVPDHLVTVMVGMFFVGFIQPLSFVPCLPETIDQVAITYNIVEGLDEELDGIMHDTIASLYNFFYSLSAYLSPIIAGGIHDLTNYVDCNTISMGIIAFYALLYMLLSCTCSVNQKTREE